MTEQILVVGRNSFIARAMSDLEDRLPCRFVSHHEVDDPEVFEGVDCVVNCALPPACRRQLGSAELDFEVRLGRSAAACGARYVMLSSRKVYHPDHQVGAGEEAPTGPWDAYGGNKLLAEAALRSILGDRLTILRIANVAGWEPGRPGFMGRMLSSLAGQGRITLDVSPFVERDFLGVEDFCRILNAILRTGFTGTVNVGSGTAVPVGRIALWLVEGFGSGELLVTSAREHDAFRLDTGRLRSLLGLSAAPAADLRDLCRQLGYRLRKEAVQRPLS